MIKFFTGITTAPRREPTIHRCVESLAGAGFEDLVIFAEPDSELTTLGTTVRNHRRLGVWHNWLQAAEWAALSRSHGCTHALIVQDDIEVHPDTRSFLEKCIKSGPKGIYSIYTPAAYSCYRMARNGRLLPPGLRHISAGPHHKLWGACGLMYETSLLDKMTKHPLAESWLGADGKEKPSDEICNSDVVIGMIAAELGQVFHFIDPSPSRHIARYSTIPGHGTNDVGLNRNAKRWAKHDEPLFDQVYPKR